MENPPTAWTESELLAEIARLPPTPVIAVDGLTRAGKSWTASRIAAAFGWSLVKCDDFVRYGELFYPNALDLPALRQELVSKAGATVILDGILLKMVLSSIGFTTAHYVYVRMRRPDKSLARPDFYEEFHPAEMLASENELCRAAGIEDDEPILERELIAYHDRYRPVASASIVFENVASI